MALRAGAGRRLPPPWPRRRAARFAARRAGFPLARTRRLAAGRARLLPRPRPARSSARTPTRSTSPELVQPCPRLIVDLRGELRASIPVLAPDGFSYADRRRR